MTIKEVSLLYIEENNADIQLLRTYISSYCIPIKLETFSNYQDALDYLNKSSGTIDVILLDYCIIGRDCTDILKLFKTNEKTKHIPVIIFSNWDNEDDKEKCFLNKADHFLVKPEEFGGFSEVCQVITKYLNKNEKSLI